MDHPIDAAGLRRAPKAHRVHVFATIMRSPNETITSRIPRMELVGLLDTMTPFEHQRVTAEIEAVGPGDIIHDTLPVDDYVPPGTSGTTTSQLELVVRFVSHAGSPLSVDPQPETKVPAIPRRLPSWAIVVASAVFTTLLGCLTMAAA